MLEKEIRQFVNNLTSLREFVQVVDPFLKSIQEESVKKDAHDLGPILLVSQDILPGLTSLSEAELQSVKDEFGASVSVEKDADSDSNEVYSLTVEGPKSKAFQQALRRLLTVSQHSEILYQNSLISLVSAGEWFLSQILHSQFDKYPESAGIADKTLKLSELQNFENMDSARRYLIDLKVEEVLRGSFEDWLTYLKGQFKLDMGYLEESSGNLVEICQRRNLLVHNGGYINEIYRRKVPQELQEDISEGEPTVLRVSEKYLTESIAHFEKSFVLIAAELWKKQEAQDASRAEVLNSIAYEHLLSERWDIASAFYHFVKEDRQTSEINRLTGLVNYWQCIKWQGKFEDVKKEIELEDFSAKEEKFRLAKFALLDDEEEFFILLPQVLDTGSITHDNLQEWPLFRSMRETATYRKLFLKSTIMANGSKSGFQCPICQKVLKSNPLRPHGNPVTGLPCKGAGLPALSDST